MVLYDVVGMERTSFDYKKRSTSKDVLRESKVPSSVDSSSARKTEGKSLSNDIVTENGDGVKHRQKKGAHTESADYSSAQKPGNGLPSTDTISEEGGIVKGDSRTP